MTDNAISLSDDSNNQIVYAYLNTLLYKTGNPSYVLEEAKEQGREIPRFYFDLLYYNKSYNESIEFAKNQKNIGNDQIRNYLPHNYKLGNIMVALGNPTKADYHFKLAENQVNNILMIGDFIQHWV